MPEPNQLSILSGFLTGEPIRDRHGVSCSPAMREDTGEKYMVKTVSAPASEAKLEAMLLAGAFSDREEALSYYREEIRTVLEETELLQQLSRLEGFVSCESWQSWEKEDGGGFAVSLLTPYRMTLERRLRCQCLTRLEAMNLGLDLCAALAVCRRSGYLYVNLKPENIFLCDDKEFRISDLGFLPLAALEYTSLPEKYRSRFTAPEVSDAFARLNTTLDIYAAGLILYLVYNNGVMPQTDENGHLLPPEYADADMAAILLRACDPDPAARWQDPAQMGQALVACMQKNPVDDTPIVPPAEAETAEAGPEIPADAEPGEPSTDEILSQVDQALESVGVDPQLPEEAPPEETPDVSSEAADPEETPPEEAPVSDVTDILAQADELIAHETPEGVIPPEPIDVPIPPPIVLTPPEPEAPEDPEAPADPEVPDPETQDGPERSEEETVPPRRRGLIALLISLIAAAAVFLGGYLFYTQYYCQTIDGISLSGSEDRLTVVLDTAVDDALLTVVCTDSYGNTKRQTVTDKTAVFTGLTPGTRYKVQVEIYGFHSLTGTTGGVHITQKQTSILNFSVVAGAESGSAIVSFTVQGPEAESWELTYFAEGEEEHSLTFSGHIATVTGLTLGKLYSFQLTPTEPLYIIGNDTLEFTASNLIYPVDLTVYGFSGSTLSAGWRAPEGETVESWTVRCYNDSGFDRTVTVTETSVAFEDLDPAVAYTLEVSAAGMSQSSRISVPANSVTVHDLTADTPDGARIKLSWKFGGSAPEGGWLVVYTISGIAEQQSVSCASPYLELTPLIPGCTYTFSVQAADSSTVFGGSLSYTAPQAEAFSGYGIAAERIKLSMCRTPDTEDWQKSDITDFTTQFAPGDSISFAMELTAEYTTSSDPVLTLCLIRDSSGSILSADYRTSTWTGMWYKGFGRLTLPSVPEAPGSYTVDIYFNGRYVGTESFTIS